MPLFEYDCRGCGTHFEAFVTTDRTPVCPACHGEELQKLLSSPGMVTAGSGSPKAAAEAPAGCRARGGQCGCGKN